MRPTMSGSGRRPPPPGAGSSPPPPLATCSLSSAPGASNGAFKEENPFKLQLDFMINKSIENRTATSSPTARPIGGGDGSSKPAYRGIGSGSDRLHARRSAREVGAVPGGGDGGGSSRLTVGVTPSNPKAPQGRSTAQPKASLYSFDSSDEETNDMFRQIFCQTKTAKSAASAAASPPRGSPSMAEAKAPDGALGGRYASASPGPRSDGGWPETKRCPPPNLQASNKHAAAAGGRGDDGGGGSSSSGYRGGAREKEPQTSTGGSAGVDRPGITGGRSYHGGGITGRFPTSWRLSSSQAAVSQAAASGAGRVEGEEKNVYRGSVSNNIGRSFLAFHSDAWMSDGDDNPASPHLPSLQSGIAAIKAGLNRGRTPPARSPEHHDSDSSGGGGAHDGDARGRKSRRGGEERYPAPAPRRQRSSSLSLSPPRFPACGSDYSSDADSALKTASTLTGRGGVTGGSRKTSSSRQRARKRGRGETLNDRIEAMRVGSDGEGPPYGGGGGGGERKPGRVGGLDGDRFDPMGELLVTAPIFCEDGH